MHPLASKKYLKKNKRTTTTPTPETQKTTTQKITEK